MKNPSTIIKLMLTMICLLTVTTLHAQTTISTPDDFPGGAGAVKKVYCITDPVKITATPDPNNTTGATVTYVWTRYTGAGTTGTATTLPTTTANLTDVPTDPGYYTYVSSTVYTVGGCESTPSAPVTIYVLPGITASIALSGGPSTYCSSSIPAGITLTASGANNPTSLTEVFAYKYQWFRGTTLITGATNSTYVIGTDAGDATPGTNIAYTVKLTYVINPNCTAGVSNAINLTAVPLPGTPTITVQ